MLALLPPLERDVIIWGLDSGMPRGEILALKWSQIDRAAGLIPGVATTLLAPEPRVETGAPQSLREGHNVEYFTLATRSLLNRVVSRRNLPFTWAINPYRGCEFACKYCYARYTHEFMEMRNGIDVVPITLGLLAMSELFRSMRQSFDWEALAGGKLVAKFPSVRDFARVIPRVMIGTVIVR